MDLHCAESGLPPLRVSGLGKEGPHVNTGCTPRYQLEEQAKVKVFAYNKMFVDGMSKSGAAFLLARIYCDTNGTALFMHALLFHFPLSPFSGFSVSLIVTLYVFKLCFLLHKEALKLWNVLHSRLDATCCGRGCFDVVATQGFRSGVQIRGFVDGRGSSPVVRA